MEIILLFGLLAAAMLAASAVHQKRLRNSSGLSKEEFIKTFAHESVPADIAESVYDYYQHESSTHSFQVAPDFLLWDMFRKTHEDVDEDAQNIVRSLGLKLRDETLCDNGQRHL